jgi:hypothetical protein
MRWIVGLFALLATPAFATNLVCAVSSPTAMTTSTPKVEAAPCAPSEPLNSGGPLALARRSGGPAVCQARGFQRGAREQFWPGPRPIDDRGQER